MRGIPAEQWSHATINKRAVTLTKLYQDVKWEYATGEDTALVDAVYYVKFYVKFYVKVCKVGLTYAQ